MYFYAVSVILSIKDSAQIWVDIKTVLLHLIFIWLYATKNALSTICLNQPCLIYRHIYDCIK